MPELHHRIGLDFPPQEVFAWHERPGGLERLVPPWTKLGVCSLAAEAEKVPCLQLRLGLGPVRLNWELVRKERRADELLVYEQLEGPFESWRWERRFEPTPAGGTAVVDLVRWKSPPGLLGGAFSEAGVRETLRRALEFQAGSLPVDLDRVQRYGPGAGRSVAITGATGLVGTALGHLLGASGFRVRRISRSPYGGRGEREDWVRWDPGAEQLPSAPLEGLHAFVHLAGESIAGARWTRAKKEAILASRVEGTSLVSRTLAELDRPPEVLISASAVGYYGHRGVETLNEESDPGRGFLAEVCKRWEASTHHARARGIRTVHLRSGLILSARGGPLETLLIPFGLGLGGRIGTGRQYLSWIDLDDQAGIIMHAMTEDSVRGAINVTSPNPVTNRVFTDILGRVLRRPTLIPLPGIAVRALLGEMGIELLLSGQRVFPEKALSSRYQFRFPHLEDSLRHQLGRPEGIHE